MVVMRAASHFVLSALLLARMAQAQSTGSSYAPEQYTHSVNWRTGEATTHTNGLFQDRQGTSGLDWTCTDGQTAMNLILEAVESTWNMQTEVEASLQAMSNFLYPLSEDASTFNSTLTQAATLNVDDDFYNMLASNPDHLSDGVLTTEELAADPQGQQLMDALRNQLATQLGVDPSQINIDHISNTGAVSGRRLAEKRGEAHAFCRDYRCTITY